MWEVSEFLECCRGLRGASLRQLIVAGMLTQGHSHDDAETFAANAKVAVEKFVVRRKAESYRRRQKMKEIDEPPKDSFNISELAK